MEKKKYVYVCPECNEIAVSTITPLNIADDIKCMQCEHEYGLADAHVVYREKKTAVPFSMEVVEKICEIIATTEKGVHQICAENQEFPHVSNLFRWLAKHEEARDLYARAKELQAHLFAANTIVIADDSSRDTKRVLKGGEMVEVENTEWTNRSRLRVDTRKWAAAKLAPRIYGEKLELSGDKKNPVTLQIIGMEIK